MARVMLINPADFKTKYNQAPSLNRMVFPPLGLAYIAAVLEENGHDVSILDVPPLQLDQKGMRRELKKAKADIIGIQAYTSAIYQAIQTAKLGKRCARIKK